MSLIEQSLQKLDFEVEDKKSTYFNEFGHPVPRVTSILSRMIHSDALMSWANYIGMKGIKYREFMNQASVIGTNAHNAIERYLQEKIKTEDIDGFKHDGNIFSMLMLCTILLPIPLTRFMVYVGFGILALQGSQTNTNGK